MGAVSDVPHEPVEKSIVDAMRAVRLAHTATLVRLRAAEHRREIVGSMPPQLLLIDSDEIGIESRVGLDAVREDCDESLKPL